MRNLKKILALALALVMSMSLMATANAFTDDDSITDTYETAVTVLSGLKVFQGYDDGSFLPQGAITRAEVAAIIYRIVTGDVADTQVGIYADYNKFDDVASTSWYAGYVNFCANAEYIKGYDARTFGPNDPVTGYQALAMILRALGYDKNGEFTGTNWTIQTAAVGEQRGITKNITAGTLGVAATREVVAEILFRAILVPTVNYTPAFGYTIGDTSLGYKTFGLEDIVGVVVANEYADLYSASPMDEGETELNVDGESYTLAYATTVEDLGEARHAYVTGETVLAIADAGNTVWTNEGAETDIGSDSDFEDVTALEKGDAEEYINFGGDGDVYESDWRIEYTVRFTDGHAAEAAADFEDETGIDVTELTGYANNTYTKVIRAGREITDDDLAIIKGIFAVADDDNETEWINGGVYVGSDTKDDLSDDISYRTFYNDYITPVGDHEDVNGADNGEWLKVIDNDGDGVADYVFRIDFAMSVIDRISRDGEYTLIALANDDEVDFTETKIDDSDIVTEDELAAGDVVLYTKIDGVYYMSIAEMVTETIDARGINSKTETITCNGTDYVQSHIGYVNPNLTSYYPDVTDAHTEETYDLYLDHFGYVRLLIESDYNAFMLLTDGYFETNYRDEAFKAMFWNVEAGEEQEIDVIGSTADDFINTDDINNDGDRETWRRLVDAGDFYNFHNNKVYITNIAGYSQSDSGYTLIAADDSTRRSDYVVQELDIDKDTALGERVLSGEFYNGNSWDTNNRIQTTTNTQYYLVIKAEDRFGNEYVEDVITWTGYANVPDEAAKADDAVAYAVTHASTVTDVNANYYVADVVVFETDPTADRDTYFVYTRNNYNREYVWGIGYNADGEIEDQRVDVESGDDMIDRYGMIWFYEIYDDTTVVPIIDNYASKNIYAGEVDVSYDVSGYDYIQVRNTAADYLRFNPDTTPIYKVTGASNADDPYGVAKIDNWDDILIGDEMILFTDNDENVEYAIWVSASTYTVDRRSYVYSDVEELYDAIVVDALSVDAPTLTVNSTVANATAVKTGVSPETDPVTGVITGWTYVVTLDAEDGFTVAAADVAAVLATTDASARIAKEDVDGTVVITVTGMTKDNTLVITGTSAVDADALADALVAAYQAYRTDPTDTTRATLFAAAVAYDELSVKTDADANYALAQTKTLANSIANGIVNASLASVNAVAIAIDLPQLDANGRELVTWGTPTEAQYDAKVADIAEMEVLYNKAATLVKAYEDWQEAVGGLPSEVTSTRAAYEAAFAAISDADHTTFSSLTGVGGYQGYYSGCSTNFNRAYNQLAGDINTANADLVAAAKTALTGKTWTAIVGTDLTADDIEANLLAQVQAVLDAYTATDLSGVTVSFNESIGSWATVPSQGTGADTKYFQIELRAGSATGSVVNQTVSVTNNWSNASLTAAVTEDLQGITSFSEADTITNIETRLESYVASTYALTGVNANVTAPGGIHEGDKITAVVTGTHAVAGAITVTAEIIIQA